jgi:hypothetical protein
MRAFAIAAGDPTGKIEGRTLRPSFSLVVADRVGGEWRINYRNSHKGSVGFCPAYCTSDKDDALRLQEPCRNGKMSIQRSGQSY